MSPPPPPHPADPTLARRHRIARLTELGQRVGYLLFSAAVAAFVVGAVRGFDTVTVTAVIVCLAAGSVVLAPAIVFGYAVKAAEREDRERAVARQLPKGRPRPPRD